MTHIFLVGCGGSFAQIHAPKYAVDRESKTIAADAYNSAEFILRASPRLKANTAIGYESLPTIGSGDAPVGILLRLVFGALRDREGNTHYPALLQSLRAVPAVTEAVQQAHSWRARVPWRRVTGYTSAIRADEEGGERVKLLRYGPLGQEKPGALDRDGGVRDLSGVIDDISPQTIKAGLMAKLEGLDLDALPRVSNPGRIGAPLSTTGNFIAVGLNYADHAEETGAPIPKEPILFNKAPSCIVGPDDDVILPKGSKKSDWEVELAFVIGKRAQDVPETQAMDHVLGYMICNDVSEREYQIERGGGQWTKGKGCPTFGPIGPWLVTRDEVADPQLLPLWLEVNGEKVQNGSTKTMIFPVATLVSHISQFMILEPGDIVTTGTPPGVGLGMKPPRFLKSGDTMRVGIEGMGVQEQRVR